MIDNNIKQALGAGSGIDTKNLVDQLTQIERAGPQSRIDKKRESNEAKISDLGRLASELGTLKSAVAALKDREGLFSKSASFTESNALVPVGLETTTQPGTYTFTVKKIARAHSLAFNGLASPDAKVGEGVLTFSFGSWGRDGDGTPTAFTAGKLPDLKVTIDANNNSLTGLRDAINKLDSTLQASIVSDGNGHRLVLTAPSGAASELRISAEPAEGTAEGEGLHRFAFNAEVPGFAALETQAGRDAELTLNGLNITRSSNKLTDLVPGLTMDILKEAPDEPVTVTIGEDKAMAESTIRDFVAAFNTFYDKTRSLFGFNAEEERAGALKNEAAAKSVFSQIRAVIASAIPGLDQDGFTALAAVGIRTELNGKLSIDEKTFSETMSDNFGALQKLFGESTGSSTQAIGISKYSERTASGVYDVEITQQPRRGFFVGSAISGESGGNYGFAVTLNGVESGLITIDSEVAAAGGAAMAEALANAINADSALAAVGVAVNVSFDPDTGAFTLESNRWGSNSKVEITAASDDFISHFGIGVGSGTAGRDVAGSINGVAAFGLGNVLLPKLGEAGEGLSLIIGEDAVSGTVNLSRGFAGELDLLMTKMLKSDGAISQRETNLKKDLTRLDDQEDRLDRKMEIFYERLNRQFIAMEAILNGLNSQGGFLENLIDTLPFTAKRD